MHLAVNGIDILYQLWVLVDVVFMQVCAICCCDCPLWFLFQCVLWQALQDGSLSWGQLYPFVLPDLILNKFFPYCTRWTCCSCRSCPSVEYDRMDGPYSKPR
jgi:hypothetical protein